MSLVNVLRAAGLDDLSDLGGPPRRRDNETKPDPVWRGPEVDGITFSLLSRFLACRERFRILVVEGLASDIGFNHRIEYGNMWHICEEAYAGEQPDTWSSHLLNYVKRLAQQHETQQELVDHWYRVCRAQFPVYIKYWSNHPDKLDRRPLMSEECFKVPYKLPSGRTVLLRGKWDSNDIVGRGKSAGIYLQENKTKGDINPQQIARQLTFDLQTMIYLIAFRAWQQLDGYGEPIRTPEATSLPILGVRYNVVRRPLSGGKGTIQRHKPSGRNPAGESKEHFYNRLQGIIKEDPAYYFMRWKAEVTNADMDRFACECLNPILEQLCDWWAWIVHRTPPGRTKTYHGNLHWRHPYGVYNPMDEGATADLDSYLATGSIVGLTRVENLFPELRDNKESKPE